MSELVNGSHLFRPEISIDDVILPEQTKKRVLVYDGKLLDGPNVKHPEYGNPLKKAVFRKFQSFQVRKIRTMLSFLRLSHPAQKPTFGIFSLLSLGNTLYI